jgi:hypothetical protein
MMGGGKGGAKEKDRGARSQRTIYLVRHAIAAERG